MVVSRHPAREIYAARTTVVGILVLLVMIGAWLASTFRPVPGWFLFVWAVALTYWAPPAIVSCIGISRQDRDSPRLISMMIELIVFSLTIGVVAMILLPIDFTAKSPTVYRGLILEYTKSLL